jgi:hypothetical protein
MKKNDGYMNDINRQNRKALLIFTMTRKNIFLTIQTQHKTKLFSLGTLKNQLKSTVKFHLFEVMFSQAIRLLKT